MASMSAVGGLVEAFTSFPAVAVSAMIVATSAAVPPCESRVTVSQSLAGKIMQDAPERMAAREIGIAIGAEDEDPRGACVLCQMLQQAQAGVVSPVQIIQQQRNWPLKGQCLKEARYRPEEALLFLRAPVCAARLRILY